MLRGVPDNPERREASEPSALAAAIVSYDRQLAQRVLLDIFRRLGVEDLVSPAGVIGRQLAEVDVRAVARAHARELTQHRETAMDLFEHYQHLQALGVELAKLLP
jgi:hypothetical protein